MLAGIPNVEFNYDTIHADWSDTSSPNYTNIERMIFNLALNHSV